MERSDFIAKVDEVLTPEQRAQGNTEKLLAILDAKSMTTCRRPLDSKLLSKSWQRSLSDYRLLASLMLPLTQP